MLRIFHLFPKKILTKLPLFFPTTPLAFFSSSNISQTNPASNQQNSNLYSQYQDIFQKIGLEEKLINNTLPNAKLSTCLANICQRTDISNCNKRQGLLIYTIASKLTVFPQEKQDFLANYVLLDKIQSSQQLDRAISFAKSSKEDITTSDFIQKFEEYCGVGLSFTDDDIKKAAKEYIENHRDALIANGNITNINKALHLKELRELLPGVNGGALFQIFSNELEIFFKDISSQSSEKENSRQFSAAQKIFNLFARDMTSSVNSSDLLKKHHEATGGKIVTRFPPEPNGYLHLGHAKAMRFSFNTAKTYEGVCYLRYDDTNPLTESEEFVKNIEDNVRWLGYQPAQITHASDYFQNLFDFAVELIKKGKAYVCTQPQEEMQEFRKEKKPSPSRDRSPEESLDLFYRMKAGEFKEGSYCLRLKIDYANENPTLRDPVAFRIKYHPHPQTGEKWCIFPTYDFTHGVCDSLENITHSLCSLEFEIRRDLYYWILEALDIYRPMVWEFSRLNITKTVLSKRKLAKLVKLGIVKGWDDPRLLTINGMRRRGFTPSGINSFCDEISVTRRGNETMISLNLLEHCIRRDLDQSSSRAMAVFSPLKVVITNVNDNFEKEIEVYPYPKDKEKEKPYKIALAKEVFIEKNDFREENDENFFGLSVGKIVRLRYADYIKCTEVIKDANGEVVEVKVEKLEPQSEEDHEELKKIKGYIHWISCKDSIDCEVRLYEPLFTVENPNEFDDFLEVVDKDSLKVLNTMKFNKRLLSGITLDAKFQFERVGYFCLDQDSEIEKGKLVFNRTLELNEKKKEKVLGKSE